MRSSMAKFDDESKPDGLEILSVGALYTGTWDKKYWSSSRGKDRYPYPVGYQALRTHKGLTYKMEIHEGSKGPIFQITSNDKHFGSGETPDRACENFQKQCCSRIKLWHGKRSSGKIDGVEFFGFKNALVQRLLRELVATLNDASDQSSVLANYNEASSKVPDVENFTTHDYPDLRPYLEKITVTGKRSRTCRGAESGYRRCQPPHQVDPNALYYVPGKIDVDKPLISCGLSDCHDAGALQVLPNKDLGANVLLSTQGSSIKSHGVPADPKADPFLIPMQSEHPSMETCASISSPGIGMPQEVKPEEILNVSQLHRQCTEIRGVGSPVATKEGHQKIQVLPELPEPGLPVQRGSRDKPCDVLGASDALDTLQEITPAPTSGSHGGEAVARNEPVADLVFSEESEYDSVEDIAKSMMAVLLPRAVPLLKYSSRKRRKTKPPKESSYAPKLENNPNGATPSDDVKCPAGMLACSALDGQVKAHPSVFVDSGSAMMESISYVVPDSLDKDQYEDYVANEPPPSFAEAEAVAANLQKETHKPDKEGLSPGLCATDSLAYQNETTRFKENFSHAELQKNCDRMSPNDCVLALHCAVSSPSSVPLDLVATSKDQCLNANIYSEPIDISSNKTDLEVLPDSKGKINNDVMGPETPYSLPRNISPKVEFGASLSESISCRSIGYDCVSEMHHKSGTLVSPNSCQVSAFGDRHSSTASFIEGSLEKQISNLQKDNVSAFGDSHSSKASFTEGSLEKQISNLQKNNVDDVLVQNCDLQDQAVNSTSNKHDMQFIDGCDSYARNSKAYIDKDKIGTQVPDSVYQSPDQGRDSFLNCASHIKDGENKIDSSCLDKHELIDEIEGTMKLIGCYSHPMRISSVTLKRISHEIYICVSCGLLEERKRDLFLYKLSIKELCLGSPCMVGHTSMSLPVWKDEFGREVAVDKSGLQFAPDARSLVLADSIRVPYCREKNLHCLCSQCESCCFSENAVKIVQIKLGYASLVLKLNTIFPVQCVLVCEPEHLIAVDESGRIYIWIMNSTWSVQREVYVIPSNDFLPSRVVELKKIPKLASKVIGHNGYGEFSVWDIIKRTVVSRFSAPSSTVLDFLPVSLFSWPSKALAHSKTDMEGCVRKLEEATMLCFSRNREANISGPMEGEDFAVWLFICTLSDSDVQSACYSSNHHLNLDGCWRLGLLIKDVVILGAAFQSSTTAIGSASGTGIIGTHEGQVYVWELATRGKVEKLCDLEGNRVLHVATDDLTSSVVAIAGEDGQLCIYFRS